MPLASRAFFQAGAIGDPEAVGYFKSFEEYIDEKVTKTTTQLQGNSRWVGCRADLDCMVSKEGFAVLKAFVVEHDGAKGTVAMLKKQPSPLRRERSALLRMRRVVLQSVRMHALDYCSSYFALFSRRVSPSTRSSVSLARKWVSNGCARTRRVSLCTRAWHSSCLLECQHL